MRLRRFTAFRVALAAALAFAGALPLPAAYAFSKSDLPQEAQDVLGRVQRGGPFRYERDGVVFGNYERLLPAQPRGYYREYTVNTPGARHRGARRLVVGCERTETRARTSASRDAFAGFRECTGPAEVYYTDDHYRSFRQVMP